MPSIIVTTAQFAFPFIDKSIPRVMRAVLAEERDHSERKGDKTY